MKQKVVEAITHDPKWYASILNKQFNTLLRETVPIELNIRHALWLIRFTHRGKSLAAVCLLFILFTAWTRQWDLMGLLLFYLPLSSVILLIYSQRNISFITYFQLFAWMLLLYLLLALRLRVSRVA